VTIAGPPEVTREIADALRGLRVGARRIELVSPLRERKGIRFAFRVDTDDDRTVKLRHFGTAAAARSHLELRADLEDAFAPAFALWGAVVFEEWIDGTELTDLDPEIRCHEAGALLGRLHGVPLGPGVAATCETRRSRAAAESDLAILDRAACLSSAESAALRRLLERYDPGTARVALIHKDFCAENMLVDRSGRLRVIDNEQIEIAPADFDLGRTFHRWPMSEQGWARFVDGYRSSAPADPGAIGFWRIAATLVGARVFLERIPERLDASLALLRRFAAGRDLEQTPAS
jgi:Ser/Thr protein kinase RdoA (MazF antagonist)